MTTKDIIRKGVLALKSKCDTKNKNILIAGESMIKEEAYDEVLSLIDSMQNESIDITSMVVSYAEQQKELCEDETYLGAMIEGYHCGIADVLSKIEGENVSVPSVKEEISEGLDKRALELYPVNMADKPFTELDLNGDKRHAFKMGALLQKEETINKAVEYIITHIEDMHTLGCSCKMDEYIINDFRKAMKGE